MIMMALQMLVALGGEQDEEGEIAIIEINMDISLIIIRTI